MTTSLKTQLIGAVLGIALSSTVFATYTVNCTTEAAAITKDLEETYSKDAGAGETGAAYLIDLDNNYKEFQRAYNKAIRLSYETECDAEGQEAVEGVVSLARSYSWKMDANIYVMKKWAGFTGALEFRDEIWERHQTKILASAGALAASVTGLVLYLNRGRFIAMGGAADRAAAVTRPVRRSARTSTPPVRLGQE